MRQRFGGCRKALELQTVLEHFLKLLQGALAKFVFGKAEKESQLFDVIHLARIDLAARGKPVEFQEPFQAHVVFPGD